MAPLKIKVFFVFLQLCAVCFLYGQITAPEAFTLLHPVSLYAEPESGAPVITTLAEGTQISFQEKEQGWIRMNFSGEINAWVAICFLKDGKYTDDVIFRTSPTAAASKLRMSDSFAGKKAEIIAEDASGYWKKVHLKSVFSGYVSQRELESSLKQQEDLHKIKPFFIISTAVGRLLPLKKNVGAATHKLIYKVHNAEYLVAYVIPDKVNLKLWEDWVIYISGESIWIPAVFTPFMKGENIFPAYR